MKIQIHEVRKMNIEKQSFSNFPLGEERKTTNIRGNKKERSVLNKISKLSIYPAPVLKLSLALALFFCAALLVFAGDVVVEEGDLNVSNDLLVNTDTLYVDSTNNRVGIGTSSPAALLSVGNESFSSAVAQASPSPRMIFDNVYDNSGDPSPNKWVFYNTATWMGGIGMSLGDFDFFSGGNFKFHTDANGLTDIGDLVVTFLTNGDVNFGDKFYYDISTNRLGLGLTSPEREIHVKGTTTMLRFDRLSDTYGPAFLLVSKSVADVVQKSWLVQGQPDQFYIVDWGTAVSGSVGEGQKRLIIQDGTMKLNAKVNITNGTILGSPASIQNLTMFTNPSGNPACCGVMDDMNWGCTAGACA